MFLIGLLQKDLSPLEQMLNDMFPLKYKIVCFLLANTKQYVFYQITKLYFLLANTKKYVFYRTKDAKDIFFSIRITKDMFSLGKH